MASGDVASLAVSERAGRAPVRFDTSRLVLYAFAALLVRAGHPADDLAGDLQPAPTAPALSRWRISSGCSPKPAFVDPLHYHFHRRRLLFDHLLRGGRADGLAGRAHRPAVQPRHPRAGDGLLRYAAVSRRHRLGAAGGAQQRAAQQILSLPDRRAAGRISVQYLFDAGADLRHLLLHLPLCLRADRQFARPHAGRSGGRLVHPRRARLDHGPADHDSAGAAGAAGGRDRRLPAGHHVIRLARDPGAAGRLPYDDDQDLEPVPVSAQAGAGRGRLFAASHHHRDVAARRAFHPRPPRLFGGGGKTKLAAADPARPAEMRGAWRLLLRLAAAGDPALWRADQRRLCAHRHHPADLRQCHFAQFQFRVLRTVGHQAGAEEHLHPRRAGGNHRHGLGAW